MPFRPAADDLAEVDQHVHVPRVRGPRPVEDAAELVEPAVEGLVLLDLRIDPGSEKKISRVNLESEVDHNQTIE